MEKYTHQTKYTFGDFVYLKTDANQDQWIIVDIHLYPNGLAIYTISCGSYNYTAWEIELSSEMDKSKKLGI